jgi:DNA-binding NarL/FixJ family response regulator
MLGAAETIGVRVSSIISTRSYEEVGAMIRGQIGDERFTAAWEAGHTLTMEQAVAQALEIAASAEPERQEPSPLPPPAVRSPLTRREREIARFLARGDTDQQIAETLFLTTGTVGWHVHRILQKLDLRSRRQVADWLRAQES